MDTRLNELIVELRARMDPKELEISNLLVELRGLRAISRKKPPTIFITASGSKIVIGDTE